VQRLRTLDAQAIGAHRLKMLATGDELDLRSAAASRAPK
jgi:hypothetical protein